MQARKIVAQCRKTLLNSPPKSKHTRIHRLTNFIYLEKINIVKNKYKTIKNLIYKEIAKTVASSK